MVVVGAGVSGCACAIALAEAGIASTLVGSSLDVVGLPGYGPDVWIADPDSWARIPVRLRDVWERGAYVPDDGTPLIVIDRRLVSLGTKQLLEGLALVDLRQGLVVDVRPSGYDRGVDGGDLGVEDNDPGIEGSDPGVEVPTVFGDVVEGAACVLAVGLGLGGRVTEGERRLAGARYGEVAADALHETLRARGIVFRQFEREVGERFVRGNRAGHPGDLPQGSRHLPLRRSAVAGPAEPGLPGEGLILPPGPHEIDARGSRVGEIVWSGLPTDPAAGVFPDGSGTGEWCTSPGYEAGPSSQGQIVRLSHRVSGQVVVSLDADGLLEGHRSTWVVGQAAGARSYLDSLIDGTRVAGSVAAVVQEA